MFIYIYMYIYIHHITYIYIYRERETEEQVNKLNKIFCFVYDAAYTDSKDLAKKNFLRARF